MNENGKKRTCTICYKTFKTAKYTLEHINNVHKGLKYKEGHYNNEEESQCETCGKYYKTKSALKSHIRHIHQGGKFHKCETCGHIRHIQEGVKIQKCERCGQFLDTQIKTFHEGIVNIVKE